MSAFRPKLFRWQDGRQDSGYRIFPIIHSTRFKIDLYLIWYPKGSGIKPHKDPAMFGQRHYRLNIEVKRAKRGGEFQCTKSIINWWRIKLFRPDLYLHSVTEIVKGSRLIISAGWLRKPEKT